MKNTFFSQLTTNGLSITKDSDEPLVFHIDVPASAANCEVELFSLSANACTGLGFPVSTAKIHCQKRQKGDIPGTEVLSEEHPICIADPAIILSNGKESLLCGFLENHIHLGRFEWSNCGLRAVAEYHPAYRPQTEHVSSQKIIVLTGKDPALLLEEYASFIANHFNLAPEKKFPRYAVGANWHYYGPTMTEEQLDEELDAIKKHNIPLDVYQIDDGWERDYGDWSANAKWRSGMKHAAEKIKRAGMIPGIWITPFLCGDNAPIGKAHPEWLLKDANGTPLTMRIGPIPFKIFDPSHPECAVWLKSVLQEIYSWGYRYYKIDFTRCLFLDPAAVPFDRSITLLQLYRKGIKLLRDTLGSECCLNLCGGHEGATIGLADVTRSGSDTYGSWAKSNGAWTRIQQCVMRNWMNRFRMTDPDASIMRLNDCGLDDTLDFTPHYYMPNYSTLSQGSLNDDEAGTFILNQFLGGGIAEIGERLPDLQVERLAMLRKIVPACGTPALPLDFFQLPLPRFYRTHITPHCKQLPEWDIVSVLNISDDEAKFIYPGKIEADTLVFDLNLMELHGIYAPGSEMSTPAIPPHGSCVLKFMALPEERVPFFVASDVNYSAGGVEVTDIEISAAKICGKLSSPWRCQVKLAGAFPLPDGISWRIVTTTAASNGDFVITL
ncbi:MAG: alpha-galactosidase [Lentisphaeria bacterium]|nr:alpha-galactosidase [Lentisphaeria bacterium]